MFDDERLLALTDAFASAAFDGTGWYSALDELAQATGSVCGELIALGEDATLPLNIMTNLDPAFLKEFVAYGGPDPQVNARVRTGWATPALRLRTEADFVVTEAQPRDPRAREFEALLRRWDVPNICLTPLERRQGLLIGLAVVRTDRQGTINGSQREVFAALAPHVRSAVRTHQMLEGEGAKLLASALEELSIKAFVCDRAGRVKALTPAAEALLRETRIMRLSGGQLQAAAVQDARALSDGLAAAASAGTRPDLSRLQTVILRGAEPGTLPLVLGITALPYRQLEFSSSAHLLVVVRGSRNTDQPKFLILQAAYGLTAAEADIALQIGAGKSVDAIAGNRGVSVGTVRVQIKTILAKLGVKRQAELVAALARI